MLKNRTSSVVAYALLFLLIGLTLFWPSKANATTGIPSLVSFQGKIVKSDGTNIADGTYNMEFKIYSGPSNTGAGDTLLFTEDWLVGSSQGGVAFTSGTYTKNIGSAGVGTGDSVALSSLNFNQYPLWLSVQIGNTSTCTITTSFQSNCGGDGEMTPYIQFTSAPYALNSNQVGGFTASQLGQLATNQTWTGTNNFQPTVSTTALQVSNASNAVLTVDTSGNNVVIGKAGSQTATLELANATGTNVVGLQAAASTNAYTLTLPGTAPGLNQCLMAGASTATNLVFGSCGASTLQAAYTGSTGGTTPEIVLDSTRTSLDVQAYSGQVADILDLRAYTASGLGTVEFGVSPGGNVSVNGNQTFNNAATLSVATAASGAGNNLTIAAGQGASGSTGGNLLLQAGANGTANGTPGSVIVKANGGDSTNVFQVQNASGSSVLSVDTLNQKVAMFGNGLLAAPNLSAGSNSGGSLSGGSTYYYRISAIVNGQETPLSPEGSFSPSGFTPLAAPAAAPTASAVSGGSMGVGTYIYEVTFTSRNGETTPGGSAVSVTTTSGNQAVSLTNIPTGPAGTYYRNIYRTAVGGTAGSEKWLAELANNTATTYNDTTADNSLGQPVPATNTAYLDTNVISVSFSSVTGATGYRVYRGTSAGAETSYQTASSSPFTDSGGVTTYSTAPASTTPTLAINGGLQVTNIPSCQLLATDTSGNIGCASALVNSINQISVFGHSYALGGGASNYVTTAWGPDLASMLHAQLLNQAKGGAVAAWDNTGATGDGGYATVLQDLGAYRTSAPYVGRPGIGVVWYGNNDIAALGATNYTPFNDAMNTIIARERSSAVFEETDSSVAFAAGGGAAWTQVTGSTSKNSGTGYEKAGGNGNTVTVNVPADFPGGEVDLGWTTQNGGGSLVTATVDGSAAGSLDLRSQAASGHYLGMVQRLTGLTPGAHTIVATISNYTGFTAFDYWQIEALNPRIVVIPGMFRVFNYTIWNGSPWVYVPSDSDVPNWSNDLTNNVINQFDNLVIPVNIDNVMNKDLQNYAADLVHPNDQAHAKIAAAIYQALQQVPISIQQYSQSSGPVNYSNGLVNFQNWVDSTTAFQIQNAAGTTSIFNADTTNGRIGIGTTAPTYQLDIRGNGAAAGTFAQILSGSAVQAAGIVLGRTALDATVGVAGKTGDFSSTSQSGDLVVRSINGNIIVDSAPGNISFTTGAGTDTAKMVITNAGNVGIGATSGLSAALTVQGSSSANDSAILGANSFGGFATTAGWSITGSGAGETDAAAASSTTLTASPTISVTIGNYYMVTYTVSNYSAGSIYASLGGVNGPAISSNTGNVSQIFQATSTASLSFVPSGFTGTIGSVSAQLVTPTTSTLTVQTSSGAGDLEVRTGGSNINTFIGLQAGQANTTGVNNTALGVKALQSATSGGANVAVGSLALQNTTSGAYNIAVGQQALANNLTGSGNTAVGFQAALGNTTGQNNSAFGNSALFNNTYGASNVALGAAALYNNITGSNNTATGYQSMENNTTGIDNTANGYQAMQNNTTGNYNTSTGQLSMQTNTTGAYNTANGYGALGGNTSGSNNLAEGAAALYYSSGSNNTALGYSSLFLNTSGNYNTAVGYNSGSTDSNGHFNTVSTLQNATAIGSFAQVQASNSLVLGSVDTATNVGIGTTIPINTFSVSPVDLNSASITASQTSGSGTITASSPIFSSNNVGEQLIWADGTTESITGYISATVVTGSSTSITEASKYFRTHHIGFQVQNNGDAYFSGANSTTAFQVQNASGTALLTADTTNNGNITVGNATNPSTITFVGGATGSRPASPTKGQLYYDTSTNQLVQYNGSKWVGDARTATKIVAASNSSQAEKDAADYIATGTNDGTTINTALSALPAGGGIVYLEEGTYTLGTTSINVPDNTTLSGSGNATVLKYANSIGSGTYNAISNSDTSTGTNVMVQNLLLDGNKVNQSTGTFYGIYFNGMGAGSGSGARTGGRITNIAADNFRSGGSIYINNSANNAITGNTAQNDNNSANGIYLSSSNNNVVSGNTAQGNGGGAGGIVLNGGSSNNTITNNVTQGNSGDGIDILNSSNNNTISGNLSQSNGNEGILLKSSNTNTLTGNTVLSNASDTGIDLVSGSDYNTITGNTSQGNYFGIYLSSSTNNTISSNKIHDNGGSTVNEGITLDSISTQNSVTSNDITDTSCTTTCYAIDVSDSGSTGNYLSGNHFVGDGTHNATIHDATSGGNTYSAQQLTQNGDASFRNATNSITAFQIQNAAGTSLLTADTTNQQVIVRSGNSDATLNAAAVDTSGGTNDFPTGWGAPTGWTLSANSAVHTSGTTALTSTWTPTIGTTYQVSYTYSNCSSTNTLTITFGGVTLQNGADCVGTNTVVATASTAAALSFSPASTYTGTISNVKVQVITQTNSALTVQNSSGTTTLQVRSSGSNTNLFIGLNAGMNNTSSGINNLAVGNYAMQSNTTGIQNTANGYSALQFNTTGGNNTADGYSALQFNTTGYQNTATGSSALQSNTTGYYNTANGTFSLQSNTTGYSNTANGYQALQSNTTGIQNVASGSYALHNNTTGNYNTAYGYSALRYNTTGNHNTAYGYSALYNTTSTVASFGAITGGSGYTNGTYNNVTLTYSSGTTPITYPIVNITISGGAVTAVTLVSGGVGIDTTTVLSANASSIGGTGSGFSVPVASVTSANNNTALGYQSGYSNTTGSNNSYLGYYAGYRDSNNNFATVATLQNATAIGAYAQVQANNSIVLGSVDTATNVGIGTTIPLNTFSVSPVDLNSNSITASQTSGSGTITASGSIFSSTNVGEQLIWADGTTETITGYTSGTVVTGSSTTATETNQYFRTHHIGLQVTSSGNAYVQNSSTTAFQVQNSSGTVLLTADTTNKQVTTFGDVNTGSISGSRVISDGFESGNFNLWNGGVTTSGTGATSSIVTSPVHNGMYAATFTASSTGHSFVSANVSGNRRTDARAYVYYTSSAGTIFGFMMPGGFGYTVYQNGNNLCFYNSSTSSGTCGTNNSFTPNTWHEIEINIYFSAPDGLFTIYNDGVAAVSGSSLNIGLTAPTEVFIGNNTDGANSFTMDDFMMNSGYIQVGESANVNVGESLHVAGSASFSGEILDQTASNSTTAFQVQNAAGTPLLTADTTNQQVIVRSGSADATEGANLFSGFNTVAGWTNSGSGSSMTSIHTNGGGTTALTSIFTPTVGTTYEVSYTYDTCSATNTLSITFGGNTLQNGGDCVGSNDVVINASNTSALSFTPASTYAGTVSSVAIHAITQTKSGLTVQDVSGTNALEVRGSSGTGSLYLGVSAGSNSSGSSNLGIGAYALQANTSGYQNVAIGNLALNANTSGSDNTANGYFSMYLNTTGYGNTASGYYTLQANTTGYYNTASGVSALQNNTTGRYNTASGVSALQNNTTGYYNTASGVSALQNNTTGYYNTASGVSALQNNTTGYHNTASGVSALYRSTSAVTSFGAITGGTGYTNGNYSNVTLTYSSGTYPSSFPVANITVSGGAVTAVTLVSGGASIDTTTVLSANASSIGGTGSGFRVPVASVTSANNNTALGYQSGLSNTTGSNNSYLGYYAGYQDSNNNFATVATLQNATAVGAYAQVQSNNTLVLGSVDTPTQVVVGSTQGVNSTNLFGVSPVDLNSSTITATQSGTNTITASSAIFSANNVGEQLIWADGTTETITGYTSTTVVTGSGTPTESNQYFRTQHIGFQVTNTGDAYVSGANSTNAFQVQNTSGNNVLGVDTSGNNVLIGKAGTLTGTLQLANATGSNVVGLQAAVSTAAYNLILPSTVGAANYCLANSATPGTLTWTNCGSHTKKLNLTAEYAGSVLTNCTVAGGGACGGSDVNNGTMTSGWDPSTSDGGPGFMNYYNWTSTVATAQTYDVMVRVPIPSDWNSWTGTNMTLYYYDDNNANTALSAQVIGYNGTTNTYDVGSSGTMNSVTLGTVSQWNTATFSLTNADYSAGGYAMVRLRLSSSNSSNIRLGGLQFNYVSAY